MQFYFSLPTLFEKAFEKRNIDLVTSPVLYFFLYEDPPKISTHKVTINSRNRYLEAFSS